MLRHHFETMGTVASFAVLETPDGTDLLPAIERDFEEIEDRFSLYRASSEISRIARGDLALTAASEQFLEVYAAAIEWKLLTNGAFDPHRPDGVIDLSGIVKAQAIQWAVDRLTASGITDALISVGGDGTAIGRLGVSAPWTAGIVDPDDRTRVLCSVPLDGAFPAIATSGTAERGEHVWGTRHGEYRQVTVLGPDIVTADVLATAILSADRALRDEVADRWPVDVLTVDAAGRLEVTPRLRRLITQPQRQP